jgi:hypothetical protein
VSTGAIDEQYLKYTPWDSFRDLYLMGANRTVVGRPIEFTIKPDDSIQFWPIPNGIYNINGEFYKRGYSFTSDIDVPVFPRFHLMIVWKAVMMYSGWSGNPSLFAYAEHEYNKLMSKLEATQKSDIGVGGSLC